MVYVKLGPKANFFFDAFTGVSVAKGEIKELRDSQVNSIKIRNALSTRHLVYSDKPGSGKEKEKTVEYKESIKDLNQKVLDRFNSGMEISKIAKDITIDQAKQLAEENGVEVEDTDTVETILEAILDE